MGYGSYKAADWEKLKNSRGINNSSSAASLFNKNEFKDIYNPLYINVRESRDSEDSPNSTPIIFGFDVTGSMDYLAVEIAKNSLNKTITELYDKKPVTDPHVMCAAFTAPRYNGDVILAGALQVTQFEADIRVVEQLLDLNVKFGGNRYSYDDLVWYFAANHTDIDCYNKRKKKGYIICIGDEICGADDGSFLSERDLLKIFGDNKMTGHLNNRQIYDMAAKKYEIFHIVTLMGWREGRAFNTWNHFMPGRVATIDQRDISLLSEVITSIMQLSQGANREDVIGQWPEEIRSKIRKSVEPIFPAKPVPDWEEP